MPPPSQARALFGSPAGLALEPRRFGVGRRALVRSVEGVFQACGGRALYRRLCLSPGRFRVRRERLAVADLMPGLRGFRIAHLSDLHAGPFVGAGSLAGVIAAARAERVSLACISGDLITHRWDESLALLADLARLREQCPVVAVLGNHDYRGRHEGRIAAALAAVGVRLLRNACERIDTGAGCLAIVGLEDLEEAREIDLAGARAALSPGDVEVVLCHNPAGAVHLARAGCAAVLSGHTHGHQIDLPILRRAAPRHPGDRLERGSTACITSRGLGALGVPLRVRAAAELVILELVCADARSAA
jgi:hypothetical protein